MKNKCKRSLGLSFCVLLASFAQAECRPASPFADHMVLQRNSTLPVWGEADPGEKIIVTLNGQKASMVTGKDGKWLIRLKGMAAGGPFDMKITGRNTLVFHDIYLGEVWLCSGQSNMDMTVAREDRYWCGVYNEQAELASANYPLIRVFDIDYTPLEQPAARVGGQWELCSPATVGHFSAAAYFFARELYNRYKVPIGVLTTAYGASTAEAWISKKTLASDTLFSGLLRDYERKKTSYDTSVTSRAKYALAYARWQQDSATAKAAKKDPPRTPKDPDPKHDQHNPYVLYNGMVAPLIPYAIKGVIWYQGESNIPSVRIYDVLMAALIGNWRADWGQGDFPFIYVQLANYGKFRDSIPGKGGGTTLVREQQLHNLSISHTGMVVAIDNADDPANIHPKNKQEIGRRLALSAEALAYDEKVSFSGPIFDGMKREAGSIRLSFTHVDGGLVGRSDGRLTGFAIAGGDRQFVWADAQIDGETILVSSPAVANPVAVRYAWGDNPLISLYNKTGLPASPFRTDAWTADPNSRMVAPWKFDFGPGKTADGYTQVLPSTLYTPDLGYGFDFGSAVTGGSAGGRDALHDGFCSSGRPFYFSVKVPEGNYSVTLVVGDQAAPSVTTVRAECRRLMVEKLVTRPGEFATVHFTVHVRDSIIRNEDGTRIPVRLKPREYAFLHWDDKLTLEFSNTSPKICAVEIRPAKDPVQVFLAGNSTVVDQADEPWAAWGQMIPAFFQPDGIVIANYAESGETLKAFAGERRLAKVWSMAHPGDYLFIEFAHNDQKPGGNYLEPFTTYKEKLTWYITEARQHGMIPVLVTSMNRRSFDSSGHIINTLGDYPEAMRQTAKEMNTGLVDLNAMSKTLYEAWGPEQSVHAFVHYPANSFPGQEKELKDNTHFNNYGAYELARCMVNGIRQGVPGLGKYLKDDIAPFDPAHPDPLESWSLPMSGRVAAAKPDGN